MFRSAPLPMLRRAMLLGAIETTGLQEYSPLRVSLALTANANHGERILSAFTFSPEASLHLIAFKFLIHFAHDVTPIAASEFLRNKQQLRRLALGIYSERLEFPPILRLLLKLTHLEDLGLGWAVMRFIAACENAFAESLPRNIHALVLNINCD